MPEYLARVLLDRRYKFVGKLIAVTGQGPLIAVLPSAAAGPPAGSPAPVGVPVHLGSKAIARVSSGVEPCPANQCCGSMTFWGGSGTADPCLWLMDPDSDPDPGSVSFYFRHWPSRCQQFFNTIFSAYDFLKLHLHPFSKVKIQGFSYYFCMMIEGSGSGSRAGSGSGSWRPKNTWVRWIRIRIRIRNTAANISQIYWIVCHN